MRNILQKIVSHSLLAICNFMNIAVDEEQRVTVVLGEEPLGHFVALVKSKNEYIQVNFDKRLHVKCHGSHCWLVAGECDSIAE